jgi:hypothetical protein
MMIADRQDVIRRVTLVRQDAPEKVLVEAAFHMLGGSENWVVRSAGERVWLENRQNTTRVAFAGCPSKGTEIEFPEDASPEARAVMNRAMVAIAK